MDQDKDPVFYVSDKHPDTEMIAGGHAAINGGYAKGSTAMRLTIVRNHSCRAKIFSKRQAFFDDVPFHMHRQSDNTCLGMVYVRGWYGGAGSELRHGGLMARFPAVVDNVATNV